MTSDEESPEGIVHPVDQPIIQQNPASVRPGIVAPIFPLTDSNDPLYPSNLETRSMAVHEVIDSANNIRHKCRDLSREPSWPPVLHKLLLLEIEYKKLAIWAEFHYKRNLHYHDLIKELPMNNLDNIKALIEIEKLLEDSKQVWEDVYLIFTTISNCIHLERSKK